MFEQMGKAGAVARLHPKADAVIDAHRHRIHEARAELGQHRIQVKVPEGEPKMTPMIRSRVDFPDDLEFKDKMLSDRMVGALLALLLDHYVQRSEKAVMLSPTKTSIELKMEHMLANSPALQFIYWLEMNDPLGSSGLIGMTAAQLTNRFVAWRLAEGDTKPWSEANVVELFRPQVDYYRSSVRGAAGKPVHVKKVKGFKTNTTTFLQYQRGAGIYAVASDTTDSTLVDD